MSAGTAQALKLSDHRVKIVSAMKQLKIGSWTVLPFDVIHDAEEPLGFLLANGKDKIFYSGDTAYIKYKFKRLTHILIEANYEDSLLQENIDNGKCEPGLKNRLLKTHMSLSQVIGFLKANDLRTTREIILIHISDRNANAEQMREIIIKETGKPVRIE